MVQHIDHRAIDGLDVFLTGKLLKRCPELLATGNDLYLTEIYIHFRVLFVLGTWDRFQHLLNGCRANVHGILCYHNLHKSSNLIYFTPIDLRKAIIS